MLTTVLIVLHVIVALAMIGLVLIQHGKGADMGASFGGGASGSLFGATGSANFLSRSTAACAALFFVCTLVLAFMSNSVGRPSGGESVLDRPAASASAAASAAIPGGTAAMPAASAAAPAPAPASTPAIPVK